MLNDLSITDTISDAGFYLLRIDIGLSVDDYF